MKKLKIILLLVFVASGFYSRCHSQGLQAGFFVQPLVTDFHYVNHESNTSTNSSPNGNIYMGLTLSYFGTERLGMGTGLSYGKDGETYRIEELVNGIPVKSYSYKYIFSSLKVPMLVKYHIKIKHAVLMLEGGLQFSYLLKAINKTTYGTFNYTDDYADIQVGFQAGFGVGIPISEKFKLIAKPILEFNSIRFQYSEENKSENFPLGHNLTSSTFGIQLGITWENKKTTKAQPGS